jgi:hypothetical protein
MNAMITAAARKSGGSRKWPLKAHAPEGSHAFRHACDPSNPWEEQGTSLEQKRIPTMVSADTAAGSVDPAYKNLYRIGGAASLIAAALVLGETIVLALYPQPDSAPEWFHLVQHNPLIGWLDLWGLEIPLYLAFLPVFLALYIVLRKVDPGLMLVALAVGLLGIGVFLAVNNPAAMLALGRQFAAAGTDAERSAFLAAGQSLLANTGQRAVGGFNTALLLTAAAGLIFSGGMLRSGVFGGSTAATGLLANALTLADYVRAAVTSSEIAVLIVILPNVLFLSLWFFLTGRDLIRLDSRWKSPGNQRKSFP